jgi:hypothetical protein
MMPDKKTSAVGIYSTRESVERATNNLVESGFQSSDISVLLPENLGSKTIETDNATKAPEGAVSGAVLGGTVGLLVGIGALAIPGVGPLIAAEPVVTALTGVGVGGVVGGATGALVGVGISASEAEHYEGRLKKGGILLSVFCDTSEETKRAKDILDRTGAEDISSAGETST